jgi:hypothetical protein
MIPNLKTALGFSIQWHEEHRLRPVPDAGRVGCRLIVIALPAPKLGQCYACKTDIKFNGGATLAALLHKVHELP